MTSITNSVGKNQQGLELLGGNRYRHGDSHIHNITNDKVHGSNDKEDDISNNINIDNTYHNEMNGDDNDK